MILLRLGIEGEYSGGGRGAKIFLDNPLKDIHTLCDPVLNLFSY
jgi:hypothetical protein